MRITYTGVLVVFFGLTLASAHGAAKHELPAGARIAAPSVTLIMELPTYVAGQTTGLLRADCKDGETAEVRQNLLYLKGHVVPYTVLVTDKVSWFDDVYLSCKPTNGPRRNVARAMCTNPSDVVYRLQLPDHPGDGHYFVCSDAPPLSPIVPATSSPPPVIPNLLPETPLTVTVGGEHEMSVAD